MLLPKSLSSLVKRNKILVFILAPVVPLLIAFLIYYKNPVYVVKTGILNTGKYAIYNDAGANGQSSCIDFSTNKETGFVYTLKKGAPYPYAGIVFKLNGDNYTNLFGYDYLKIKIKASKGKRLPIILTTHIENYTRKEDFNTLRNNQYILNVDNELKEIILDFNDFKTPDWWYTLNNKSEKELLHVDYSKVKQINIANCQALAVNVEDRVQVQELSFHVSLLPFIKYAVFPLLLYYCIVALWLKKKKSIDKEISFNYQKTETVNRLDKEEEMVFGYLTKNYARPELTIVEVQNATGIYEQKISTLIKKKTGKNFKQFLNKLRLAEARRLLLETDLQVSEVAFKVGYSNVSHFNRVFKEHENCSPKDLRKTINL